LLLLNPDVSVGEHFLDDALLLSERLTAREPQTGVVGLRLREGNGDLQRSAGALPTLPRTLAGLLLPRRRRKYLQRELHNRQEVPWVTGCGLLVRRDCLTQVGGFGEEFFLYYEDVDFCQRARSAGWSVWYEPSLALTHHRPLQNRVVSPHLRVLTRHALLTYARKHWPRWQSWLLHGVVGIEARIRALRARLRGDGAAADTFRELASLASELRRGQMDGARRRLNRLIRREEARRAAESVSGHPQSQPAGPAPHVFANRLPVLAH
jgi:GT2 family glycosyltransferase